MEELEKLTMRLSINCFNCDKKSERLFTDSCEMMPGGVCCCDSPLFSMDQIMTALMEIKSDKKVTFNESMDEEYSDGGNFNEDNDSIEDIENNKNLSSEEKEYLKQVSRYEKNPDKFQQEDDYSEDEDNPNMDMYGYESDNEDEMNTK
jgi:hypothetical protein